MNITYKNVFDELIHENQTPQLKDYYKVYNVNDQVKQMEKFYEGKLQALIYYKDVNESHQQIMNDLFTLGKFISIIEKEAKSGGYILEKEFHYNGEGVLSSRSNLLYDVNRDLIAEEWITNLATGIPDYDKTKKFFYDRNVNPDEYLFDCRYDEMSGKLAELYYNNHHINSDGQDSILFDDSPEDILELRTLTGISQQLAEYYVSPNVIPVF